MNRYISGLLGLGLILLLLGGLVGGCASRPQQVRYLAADISMLPPGTGEREVRAVMGPPDLTRVAEGGGEDWLYLERIQSRLRRTQVLGRWMGRESYHLAVVTIRDGVLVDSYYRIPSEEEFRELQGYLQPR